MNLLKSLSFAACLFVSGSVMAQTADQIIASHKKAMGGEKIYDNIKTLYTEGTIGTMGMDLPMKVYTKNKESLRIEFEVMGAKNIQAIHKTTGWMLMPIMGMSEPQDLPADKLDELLKQTDLSTDLFNYAEKGWKVTLLGKESNGGQDEFKLHLEKASGAKMDLYVDAHTYYINKIDIDANVEGQDVATTLKMSDYHKTPEGLVVPYTLEQGEMATIKLTKVEVNKPLDDALFKKPAK
ncbi:hypothetical protein MKQ70_23930 [Chitinophaga sedimenti]|uniref:hypothetical protein n=1 Tax=Chitinophaga sedimenti TaxID=2033606 RepID=UPI002005C774|nr:hypothetical protein [Chitinophaga sedimenti]MCK7557891.1 hypothetical protein [Chitinophaga sedimenti]